METIKTILMEDMPRWYGLSYKSSPPRIRISLHSIFLEKEKEHFLGGTNRYSEEFCKAFNFQNFDWSFRDGFGFDGAFQIVEREFKKGFVTFETMLPKVWQLTDEVCKECNGTGKDDLRFGHCLYCDGKKKKSIYVWGPAYAISASLNLLLETAHFFQEDTGEKEKQLLTVELSTIKGMQGGSLSGDYSIQLVHWLSNHQGHILEMEIAMRRAHARMLRSDYIDKHSFRASVESEKGWLNVNCPGDACGLHPSDWNLRSGNGYKFSSHNVDSPAQQLTLLVGLAALCDKVDGEIEKNSEK